MLRWAPRLLAAAVVLLVGGLVVASDVSRQPGSGTSRPTPAPSVVGTDVATTTPPRPEGPWPELGDPAGPGVVLTPTGMLAPVVGVHENDTYDVQTPCDGRAVVTGTPLAGAHIVLDPGHGGDEPGASGPNGLVEKELNLAVAQLTAQALREAGATVVLTRETDMRLTLAYRAGIVLGLVPMAFVSIHHNAAPDGPSPIPGTDAYYQVASPESRRLAGLLVEEIRAALTPFGVAWESDANNGAKARVQASDPSLDFYGVLRRTVGIPSALSEAGYLSNPAEAELFARPEVQQAEADAIAVALTRFITGDEPAESAFSTAPPSTGSTGSGSGGTAGCVDPPMA